MLEQKDRVIIEQLRSKARSKLADISEETNIPVSTIHDRLKKLESNNQIRLTTLLNYRQLRMPLQSWVLLEARDRAQAKKHLQEHPNINTLLAVNNGADFACEAVFRGFSDYHAFLEELGKLGRVKDHPIIEEVCKENARVAT